MSNNLKKNFLMKNIPLSRFYCFIFVFFSRKLCHNFVICKFPGDDLFGTIFCIAVKL